MVGVLKVDNLELSVTPGEIRKLFKEYNARPDDIHLVLDKNGKHTGEAFIIYLDPRGADAGAGLNGKLLKDKRIQTRVTTPREFNALFPGLPMITKNKIGVRGGLRGGMRGSFGRGGASSFRESTAFSSPFPSRDGRPSFRGASTGIRGMLGGGQIRRGGGFSGLPIGRESAHMMQRDSSTGARDRSRSPMNKDARASFLRNFSDKPQAPPRSTHREGPSSRVRDSSRERRRSDRDRAVPMPPVPVNSALAPESINERKFVIISGLPFNVTEVEIQNFFRPVLTREVFHCRNLSGKFAGKPNGEAIVEFFSESDSRQALKMDGKRFMDRSVKILRPRKDEIFQAMQSMSGSANPVSAPIVAANFGLDPSTSGNPQVQQLLTLLTATVNSIAAASAAASKPVEAARPEARNERRPPQVDPQRDESVISRVASSANIDINDINAGRVVGIRNLPFSVTPEEILDFFHGYHAVPDSVRIHYLEDGRCSGDAIISFRSNRDARNAVGALNKRSVGRRKVDLFFL